MIDIVSHESVGNLAPISGGAQKSSGLSMSVFRESVPKLNWWTRGTVRSFVLLKYDQSALMEAVPSYLIIDVGYFPTKPYKA